MAGVQMKGFFFVEHRLTGCSEGSFVKMSCGLNQGLALMFWNRARKQNFSVWLEHRLILQMR